MRFASHTPQQVAPAVVIWGVCGVMSMTINQTKSRVQQLKQGTPCALKALKNRTALLFQPGMLQTLQRSSHLCSCVSFLTWRCCRAKAGGRQSAKDATGKSIKSAGAQIRRYNEVLPWSCLQSFSLILSDSVPTVSGQQSHSDSLPASTIRHRCHAFPRAYMSGTRLAS